MTEQRYRRIDSPLRPTNNEKRLAGTDEIARVQSPGCWGGGELCHSAGAERGPARLSWIGFMGGIHQLFRRSDHHACRAAGHEGAMAVCRISHRKLMVVVDRGIFGAIYIVVAVVLLPRLGAATVVALIVTGRMLSSLAFDQWSYPDSILSAESPFVPAALCRCPVCAGALRGHP